MAEKWALDIMYLGSIGGQHSTMVSILASGSSYPEFDSQQKNSGGKITNFVEVNQRHWFEES